MSRSIAVLVLNAFLIASSVGCGTKVPEPTALPKVLPIEGKTPSNIGIPKVGASVD